MTEFLPQKHHSNCTSNATELSTRSDKTEALCVNTANAIERVRQKFKTREFVYVRHERNFTQQKRQNSYTLDDDEAEASTRQYDKRNRA